MKKNFLGSTMGLIKQNYNKNGVKIINKDIVSKKKTNIDLSKKLLKIF